MAGFLQNIFNRGKAELAKYSGDPTFLKAACAATAMVVMADGKAEDSETDAALKGLLNNDIIKHSYPNSRDVETAYTEALANARSRSGRRDLTRALESMISRPTQDREDIFLMGADVGDAEKDGKGAAIGDDEKRVLDVIAKTLNLDANKLLAA